MIFTMSFTLTWHMSASKSNLTGLQAESGGLRWGSLLWENALEGLATRGELGLGYRVTK